MVVAGEKKIGAGYITDFSISGARFWFGQAVSCVAEHGDHSSRIFLNPNLLSKNF
jgi:hypothetical protein